MYFISTKNKVVSWLICFYIFLSWFYFFLFSFFLLSYVLSCYASFPFFLFVFNLSSFSFFFSYFLSYFLSFLLSFSLALSFSWRTYEPWMNTVYVLTYIFVVITASLVPPNGMTSVDSHGDKTGSVMSQVRMLQDITSRLSSMRVDATEYACLKALVLFKAGKNISVLMFNIPNVTAT